MTITTDTRSGVLDYTDDLAKDGFTFIPADVYYNALLREQDVKQIRQDYLQLEAEFGSGLLDPYSVGNRYRQYAQLRVDPLSTEFEYGIFEPYMQTKAYNPDTGDVVRNYPLISPELQSNQLLRGLLQLDIEFMRSYPRIEPDPSELMVGLHLFRYHAYPDDPAYSSPNWLHKDDENVVFFHLVELSGNAIGGDNVIAPSAKKFDAVIRLTNVLDTLVVNQDKMHAVTPISTTTRNPVAPARRDLLLVTFQLREDT